MKKPIPVQTCLLALALSTFALGVQISPGSFSYQYVGLRFPAPTGWYLATDSEVSQGLQEGAQIVGVDSPQIQAVVEQMPGKVLVWVSEQPPGSDFEGINRNILVAAIDVRGHRDEFASGADFLKAGSQVMKESLPEAEISEISVQRLGGEDFHKLELLLPAEELTIHQWQLARIHNDYLVILNVSAESPSGIEELFQISDGLSFFEVSQEVDSSAEGQSFRNQAAIVFPPSSGGNLLRTWGIVLMVLGVIWYLTSLGGSKKEESLMSHKGKVQLTVIFTATPDLVEQGDQIFESHAQWMEESHHREGDKALLRYNVSKGAELSNPLDPSSAPTGNTSFVLMEVYESQAGMDDHWKQGTENWADFSNFGAWASQCQVTTLHGSPVIHSLW